MSLTDSPTPSPTYSTSPTGSPSATPTASPTATPTASPSASPSATQSATPTATPGLGAVAGHVFRDDNADGLQGSEPNLANITVILVDALGVTRTAVTNAAGNYSLFAFAGPATLQVDMTDPDLPQPPSLTTGNSPQAVLVPSAALVKATAIGVRNGGTPTSSVTPTATPTPTLTFTDVPFGSTLTSTPTRTPTFSLTPSYTLTRTPSPSRTPSPTPTATATPSASPSATATASPSSSVTRTFTAVPGGSTPSITPTVSASYTASPSATRTPTAAPSASPTAGYGVVTGKVFLDANSDGLQELEPSLGGVTMSIYSANFNLTTTVLTDSFGFFSAFVPDGPSLTSLDLNDPALPAGAVITTGNHPQAGVVPSWGSLNLSWFGVNSAPTPTITPTSTPGAAPDLRVSVAVDKPVLTIGGIAFFTVMMSNVGTAPTAPFDLRNLLPPGFRYVAGTGALDGKPREPGSLGREAVWPGFVLVPGQTRVLTYAVVAGAGAWPGNYADKVYATDAATGVRISNEAFVNVRLDADPLFTDSWVLGKVFYDLDGDGEQGPGEEGIPGARIATLEGRWAETDAHGLYHLDQVPVLNRSRGSSFLAKLDPASLPPGSEITTENPRLVRLTEGLVQKINFGVRCPQCCSKTTLRTRVLFGACDDSVGTSGRQALADFASGIKQDGRATLKLQGEARCPDFAQGQDLAKRRVESVRVALAGLGLDARPGALKVQVQGERLSGGEEMRRQRWVLRPHFDSGRAELKPRDLERIAAVAAEVNGRVGGLQVFGHTDDERLAPGTKAQFADNQGLSEARAEAVSDALLRALRERGVTLPASAELRGFADRVPVANNRAHEGMALNRRVEVQIDSYVAVEGKGVWMDAEIEVERRVPAPGQKLRPCGCWLEAGPAVDLRLPLALQACELVPRGDEAERLKADLARVTAGTQLTLALSLDPQEQPPVQGEPQRLVLRPRFRSGSAELDEASVAEITATAAKVQGVVRSMAAEGHTDSQALAAESRRIYKDNTGLSAARANAVMAVFIKALVQAGRPVPLSVQAVGYGSSRPLGDERLEKGRALNRRVELALSVVAEAAASPCGPELPQRRMEALRAFVDAALPAAAKGKVELSLELAPPEAGVAPTLTPTQVPQAKIQSGLRGPAWMRLLGALLLAGDLGAAELPAGQVTSVVDEAPCVNHRLDALRSEPKLAARLRDNAVWLPPLHPVSQVVEMEVEQPLSASAGSTQHFTLRPQFASGTDDLDPDSVLSIEDVARSISATVSSLKVVGHTDAQRLAPATARRYDDNQGLSRARAAAVAAIFLSTLPPERRPAREAVQLIGRGDAEPLADNRSEAGKALNRRVEVDVFGVAAGALTQTVKVKQWVTRTAQPRAAEFLLHCNYPLYVQGLTLTVWGPVGDKALRVLTATAGSLNGMLAWDLRDEAGALVEPGTGYAYELQVYDAQGRVDHTRRRFFEVRRQTLLQDRPAEAELVQGAAVPRELRRSEAGSGELGAWAFDADDSAQRDIPLEGGTVVISGQGLAPESAVTLDGEQIWTDKDGRFVRERLLPPGEHRFAYRGLREDGREANGEALLTMPANAYFLVGLAETTIGYGLREGDLQAAGMDDNYPDKLYADGRAAIYLKGKVKGSTLITLQADTGEEAYGKLFQRLDRKDPRQVFRRLDPDRYYPIYGDASTSRMDLDTQGKVYLRLESREWKALWGNYQTDLKGGELASYQRALYGARLAWTSPLAGPEGQPQAQAAAFGAEALSAHGHDELRSNTGLLYYLSKADLVVGSEQLRIEARDAATGRVSFSAPLEPGRDYQVDWTAGRVLLERALDAALQAPGVVSVGLGAGDRLYLVADYEYAPRFEDQIEEGSVGGRAEAWLLPQLKLGVTGVREGRAEPQAYGLLGLDAELRPLKGIRLWAEGAGSQRQQAAGQFSGDGGLSWTLLPEVDRLDPALAHRVAADLDFEPLAKLPLRLKADASAREAGFSANGVRAPLGEQASGASLELGRAGQALGRLSVRDTQELGQSKVDEASLGGEAPLSHGLTGSGELKQHAISDSGYADLRDTLAAARLDWKGDGRLSLWGRGQASLARSDATPENHSVGAGARLQLTRAIASELSVEGGSLGQTARLGLDGRVNEEAQAYGALESRRDPYAGAGYASIVGTRWQASERWKVYAENQQKWGELEQGLSNVFGITHKPVPQWTLGLDLSQSRLNRSQGDPAARYNDRVLRSDGLSAGVWSAAPVAVDRDGIGASASLALPAVRWDLRGQFHSDRGGQDVDQWALTQQLELTLREGLDAMAKLNLSRAYDLLAGVDQADYSEAGLGLAWRPWSQDVLNLIAKYTWLEELSPLQQLYASSLDQRSHTFALEALLELGWHLQLDQKLAFKRSELRLMRLQGAWLQSDTWLSVTRLNYHLVKKLDVYAEYRRLWNSLAEDALQGALVGFSYHLRDSVQLGAGFNFTDFNDDLVHLNFRAYGPFIDIHGKW